MQPPCYSRMQKPMSSAPGPRIPPPAMGFASICAGLLCVLLVQLTAPQTAAAQAGNREIVLVASPEIGAWSRWTDPQRLLALQASLAYGFSDWWSITVSAGAGHTMGNLRALPAGPHTPLGYVLAGPTVALDALRVVPFLGLHAGAVVDRMQLRADHRGSALLRTQLGFDVRRRSGVQLGAAAAWHLSIPSAGSPTAFTTFGFRVGAVIETDRLR